MMLKKYIWFVIWAAALCSCSKTDETEIKPIKPNESQPLDTVYIKKAEATFDKMFELFWYDRMKIMYDKHPNILNANTNTSTYPYDLGYAFVWGYGSVLSAYNAIFQRSPSFSDFEKKYKNKIVDGLEIYYNTSKHPAAYACFPNDWDDRFYDDNVWLGIDLVELYNRTKDSWYLDKAKIIWTFILTGKDTVLGGGIYWKEGDKTTKNTCSNAPAAVLGLKLYQSTKDVSYLTTSKELYEWTKKNLQDPTDYLYWDCIKVSGTIEKSKFAYNSGQMIQAAALLYTITKNEKYLSEAKLVAESAYNYYFEKYTLPTGETITVLKKGSLWFNAIMFRGFAELHQIEKNMKYIAAFRQSLDYAWRYARDPQTGLFNSDFSGRTTDKEKDLLTQGGIIEMYARMATIQ